MKRRRFYTSKKRKTEFCVECGVKLTFRGETPSYDPTRATVDHIVPISKGGGNEDTNLRVICRKCNHEKADKVLTNEDNLK